MIKYLAWVETNTGTDLWLLIDAKSKEQARNIAKDKNTVTEIRACVEVEPNDRASISHVFTLVD